jgi:hypothetical protein
MQITFSHMRFLTDCEVGDEHLLESVAASLVADGVVAEAETVVSPRTGANPNLDLKVVLLQASSDPNDIEREVRQRTPPDVHVFAVIPVGAGWMG